MARTVIVGDIHGCYEELVELLEVAGVRDEDLLISVGDVVDRGPRPLEVIELFRARARSLVLMGNHERKHVREVFSYAQQITRLQLGARYAECVAWMRTLPYYHETPEVRVVHAAMVPGVPLADQDEDVLAGTTSGEHKLAAQLGGGYWHERYHDATPIVFGHHVVGRDPLVTPNRVYGIDTGACHGGRLTALSVPDFNDAVEAMVDDSVIPSHRGVVLDCIGPRFPCSGLAQLVHRVMVEERLEIAFHRNGPRSKSDP